MNDGTQTILRFSIDVLAKNLKYLVLISFIGAAAGVGVSYFFTPMFKAEAILIPSDEMLGLNQTSQLGGLGGLATLIGAGGTASKQNEALAIMKSRALTYEYIRSHELLPLLFDQLWNPTLKTWKSAKPPTLEQGYNLFDRSIRTVIENRKTGLISISITWKDPTLAKQWVDGLVGATNDFLRLQAIERSTTNLEYLQNAAAKTPIVEIKTTIYKLMETEIKKQMAAIGNHDYAFRVVDPAVVPEHKISPKRSVFAAFAGIISGMIWFLIVASATRKTPLASAQPRIPI